MKRNLLLTPGPTPPPDRVLLAGAEALLHHRTPQFSAVLGEVMEKLKPLFGTTQNPCILPASSRGGLEAALVNMFEAGDVLISVANGHFAQQWQTTARALGFMVYEASPDWSQPADLQDVRRVLTEHPEAKGILAVHSETSTGLLNPIAELGALAQEFGCYLLVDGVSSLGGVPTYFDHWQVDIMVTGCQKCLMTPPGLSIVVCSDRAIQRMRETERRVSYWDLVRYYDEANKPEPQTPTTTPTTLVRSLLEALRITHELGVDGYWAMHDDRARSVRRALRVMGLTIYPAGRDIAEEWRSPAVTTIELPEGLVKSLLRDLDATYGVTFARGLGRLGPTTFRIGHLGAVSKSELLLGLLALNEYLADKGVIERRDAVIADAMFGE